MSAGRTRTSQQLQSLFCWVLQAVSCSFRAPQHSLAIPYCQTHFGDSNGSTSAVWALWTNRDLPDIELETGSVRARYRQIRTGRLEETYLHIITHTGSSQKVKTCIFLIMHRAMKMYGGMEVYFQGIWNSALHGDVRSASYYRRPRTGKRVANHYTDWAIPNGRTLGCQARWHTDKQINLRS
jgi:hypothetical protein